MTCIWLLPIGTLRAIARGREVAVTGASGVSVTADFTTQSMLVEVAGIRLAGIDDTAVPVQDEAGLAIFTIGRRIEPVDARTDIIDAAAAILAHLIFANRTRVARALAARRRIRFATRRITGCVCTLSAGRIGFAPFGFTP